MVGQEWESIFDEMKKLREMIAEVSEAADRTSALANEAKQEAYDSAVSFIAAIMQVQYLRFLLLILAHPAISQISLRHGESWSSFISQWVPIQFNWRSFKIF